MRFVQGHQNRGRIEGRYIVDPETGCWEWTGRRDEDGYARMRLDGKRVGAFRVSYERKHGPIPEGLEPHHRCDNPGCVNPDHIEPLSHAENTRRRRSSKLDWEKVDAIRASDELQKVLAARFGVTPVTISLVKNGVVWNEATRG